MDSHHDDIPISIKTHGDGYPSTSNYIFPFSEDLDLYGIIFVFASHSFKYSFMWQDSLSIENDSEISSRHASSDIQFEETSHQDL